MIRAMRRPSTLLYLIPFLLFACSKAPQHTNTIPKKADWVAAYDVQAIAEKADLKSSSEYKSLDMIKKEMKNVSPEMQKMLQAFLKDPLSLGIDLSREVYSFHYVKGKEKQGKVGVVAAMSDRGKFRSNVDKLLKATGAPDKMKVKKEGGRSYLSAQRTFLVWDGSRILFLTSMDHGTESKAVKEEATRLMGLKGKSSLVNSNKDFQNFMDGRKDISNWISFKNMPSEVKEEFEEAPGKTEKGLKKTTMHSYLAFEPNSIELTHYTNNEDWSDEKIKKLIKGGLDKELMSYLPKKAYMGFSMAFHPDAVYGIAKEKGGEGIMEAEKEMKQEQGIELKKVMGSLSGDMVATVNGFGTYERTYMDLVRKEESEKGKGNRMGFSGMKRVEKTESQLYPKFSFLVKTRTPYIKEQIEKKLLKHDSVKAVGDHYRLDMTDFPIFLGWKENKIMVGSHEKAVKKLYSGGFSPSLTDDEMGSLFASSSGSASMLLDLQEYPQKVRDFLTEGRMAPSEKVLTNATSILKRIDAKNFEGNGLKVTLMLKEGDGNSLGRILKKLDDNSGTLMRAL